MSSAGSVCSAGALVQFRAVPHPSVGCSFPDDKEKLHWVRFESQPQTNAPAIIGGAASHGPYPRSELSATPFFDIQSASRRNDLAFYASMLFCRAKQRRTRSEKTYANLRQQFVDLLADDEWPERVTAQYVERTGDTIRPKVLKDRIAIFAERMNDTKELRNSFVEDLIQTTEILKNVALQKPWQLLRAPKGADFVTSDNPFITFIDLGNGRLNSGHGLRKKETIGVFPIAPQVSLVMGTEGPDEVTTDAASVTLINNTIIELCERYVYSKTLSEGVRQVVDKMANERKYGVNAFVPLGMKVPTAKDFVLHSG